MADINDGGPAFPGEQGLPTLKSGMSLRDWFAGQTLIGLLGPEWAFADDAGLAAVAYQTADAMLKERAR